MKIRIVTFFACLFLNNICFSDQPGDKNIQNSPSQGTVEWGEWKFDYGVENNDMQGLVIKNLHYKGTLAISKASLPVVRVKYKGSGDNISSGCGPFADKFYTRNFAGLFTPALSWKTIKPYKENASDIVSVEAQTATGIDYFGLYAYAEIGGYLLWQGWNFLEDGQLEPVMYSAGWSCSRGLDQNDHKHHAYWRIDFDIEDDINQVWEVTDTNPRKINIEENLVESTIPLNLIVSNTISNKLALVKLPTDDDQVDSPGSPWFSFSTIDAGIRLFKDNENNGWDFGASGELGHISTPENIAEDDIVLWLVGHLKHDYKPGSDDENNIHWHWTGPVIKLINY